MHQSKLELRSCAIVGFLFAATIGFFLSFSSLTVAMTEAEQAAKLKELKTMMSQLQKELDTTKGTRDSLLKELEKSEKAESKLSEKTRKIEKQLEQRQQNLEQLNDERSDLNQKKGVQQEKVSAYLNSAYRAGNQSHLRLLLNQEDPAKLARNLKFYQKMVATRAEKIESFSETIERLDTIEPEIEAEKNRLKQSVTQLNTQKRALKKAQIERQRALKKINGALSTQNQQLTALKLDRTRLEELLSQVSTYIQDVNVDDTDVPFREMKGKLPWPTKGQLRKRYGTTRISNKMRWQGWLINSIEGTPVKAVHHGQVVFADYLRGHGLLVIIDHGKDYYTLYAHNRAIHKELGEWVTKGETISSVGDSGGLEEHALYFELRHKGQPLNPKYWLSKSA